LAHNENSSLLILTDESPRCLTIMLFSFFFFQAEDGIRDRNVTGVQTCALPILRDREESTVVLFDESWIFNSSKNGRAIIKSMRRVGRSFNNTLIIVTQSVKD